MGSCSAEALAKLASTITIVGCVEIADRLQILPSVTEIEFQQATESPSELHRADRSMQHGHFANQR